MIQVGDNCIFNLPDKQQDKEGFAKIPIKKVGVRNIELPIIIFQKSSEEFISVPAVFSSYCNLESDTKGINMSRIARTLVEVSQKTKSGDSVEDSGFGMMEEFSKQLRAAHQANNIYVKNTFSYPYWEKTYASGLATPEYVDVVFETTQVDDTVKHYLTVKVSGISLCPCSKEMSLLTNNSSKAELAEIETLSFSLKEKVKQAGFGAHNQRSHLDITVELKPGKTLWIEDIIALAEKSFSFSTRAILKRPDEKVVTEAPYLGGYYAENSEGEFIFTKIPHAGAKFVEDISRDAAKQLTEWLDDSIEDFVVVCNNDESIHSRDLLATAILSAGRNLN